MFMRQCQVCPAKIKDYFGGESFAGIGLCFLVRLVFRSVCGLAPGKGAAGGAVQWMNRLLGFEESLGLTAPAPGWT